jgi:serine/threonine-protein kinase HipA
MVDLAFVRLWGQQVGTVRWNVTRALATFAYDPGFVKSGLNVVPPQMPLAARAGQLSTFPRLNPDTD